MIKSSQNNRQKRILLLAIKAGEIMLENGAEISRVEDTVERICRACGIQDVNVFALPTGLFVTTDKGPSESDTYTYVRRIKNSGTDLSKISMVNKFSRRFTTTDMSIAAGMSYLRKVDKNDRHPYLLRLLGSAFVAACFSTLFGGGAADFIVSFILGMFCYTLSEFLNMYEINFFIRGMVCCAFATFLALIASANFTGAHYTPIITGCIMLFVPGVAITNSIRDFLAGDIMAGLTRMADAALTAISLATGAGLVISIWQTVGGISL